MNRKSGSLKYGRHQKVQQRLDYECKEDEDETMELGELFESGMSLFDLYESVVLRCRAVGQSVENAVDRKVVWLTRADAWTATVLVRLFER